MAFTCLTVRRDGPVEFVTLARPEVRNAFNATLIAELTEWASTAARDPDLRCAVLAGAGPVFCAGADLLWMSAQIAASHDENVVDAGAAARMFHLLDTLPFGLVARVHGAALGGGAGLAAVADVVVSDTTAQFGFTEVKLGLVPAIIAPYVLARIGPSAARALFLTGMRFDAQRAHAIGLVHDLVERDALDAAVGRVTAEFCSAGPEAVAVAKALLRRIAHRGADEVVGLTSEAIALRRVSQEGQEGMRAFLARRSPAWHVSTGPDRQSR